MSDLSDDQQPAEALDEDELGEDLSDFPPDHALASLEATVVTDTGDVPLDSVAEREWREDDGTAEGGDDPTIELVDAEWDDPEELEDGRGWAVSDGELTGESVEAEEGLPAEELAIHLVDDPDD